MKQARISNNMPITYEDFKRVMKLISQVMEIPSCIPNKELSNAPFPLQKGGV